MSPGAVELRTCAMALEREQAQDLRRSVLCGELHYSRDLVQDGFDALPGAWLGLALAGPKPVGTLRLRQEGSWMLEHLAVLPAWRRRGVGRGLVNAALGQARAAGAAEVLACGPEAAGPFFSALGFSADRTEAGLTVWKTRL